MFKMSQQTPGKQIKKINRQLALYPNLFLKSLTEYTSQGKEFHWLIMQFLKYLDQGLDLHLLNLEPEAPYWKVHICIYCQLLVQT